MRELWQRWRSARRVLVAVCAAGLTAGIVVGLGQGHGAPYSLKPSAFDDGSPTTTTTAPKPRQATVGKPGFPTKPPAHAHLDANLLPADGIPSVALDAYEAASGALAGTDPGCNIEWEDLAGIGRVESDNGQTHGDAARVTESGKLFPPIYGPILDGYDGFPAIPSTDGGLLEGGGQWARAVGPMQFLPSTWYAYARSDIGDDPPDPQNFYDAAVTAGQYLCANGGNLSTQTGLTAAIYAYNHFSSYVALVEEWVAFYQQSGAQALLVAGAGELPLGVDTGGYGGSSAPTTTYPPNAGKEPLVQAAKTTDGAGSYQFQLFALAGQSLVAKGIGGVDYAGDESTITLEVTGVGSIYMRTVGKTTFVSFPKSLAKKVGAEGTWVILSTTVLHRLPQLIERALGAMSEDLVYTVAQLAGVAGVSSVAGTGYVEGVPSTQYLGTVDLQQAATDLPAAKTQLVGAAAYLGGFDIGVDVWVDAQGDVREATLALPKMPGEPAGEPFSVEILLSGFGSTVTVTVPPVSGVSTGSTTTTSTSTTTTTTTTSTTSSSTSSTTDPTTTTTGATGTGPT